MGKRLITTLLVLLTIGVQAFAQSAVSGKVTDKAGEPRFRGKSMCLGIYFL